jgi:hypothetical protein
MRKILFILLIISIHSFALTLDQVRAGLKKNSISGDSIKIGDILALGTYKPPCFHSFIGPSSAHLPPKYL